MIRFSCVNVGQFAKSLSFGKISSFCLSKVQKTSFVIKRDDVTNGTRTVVPSLEVSGVSGVTGAEDGGAMCDTSRLCRYLWQPCEQQLPSSIILMESVDPNTDLNQQLGRKGWEQQRTYQHDQKQNASTHSGTQNTQQPCKNPCNTLKTPNTMPVHCCAPWWSAVKWSERRIWTTGSAL